MTTPKAGLFAALVDLSFTRHVATRLIRVFYPLAIAVVVNVTSFWLLLAWFLPDWVGWAVKLTVVVIAPITAVAFLVFVRIILEYLGAIFTIDEKLGVLVERTPPSNVPIGTEHLTP